MPIPTPAPIAPTLSVQFSNLLRQTNVLIAQMVRQITANWIFVWNNPDPQAAIDAIQSVAAACTPASSAEEMFSDQASAIAYVTAAKPGALDSQYAEYPAGWAIAWNQDGSGTASYTAPVPSP